MSGPNGKRSTFKVELRSTFKVELNEEDAEVSASKHRKKKKKDAEVNQVIEKIQRVTAQLSDVQEENKRVEKDIECMEALSLHHGLQLSKDAAGALQDLDMEERRKKYVLHLAHEKEVATQKNRTSVLEVDDALKCVEESLTARYLEEQKALAEDQARCDTAERQLQKIRQSSNGK